MNSAAKIVVAISALFAFSANAGDSRKEFRRMDCRFYSDSKCDNDKCDEKKCDDGKKCDEPKKCDDPKKCGDGKKFELDEFLVSGKSKPKFCYASADYSIVEGKRIFKIHYGVGCDRQTIYDGRGIIEPQETVADHIRPKYAATPLVELKEQGDLRNVGSYTAKLELDYGILLNGHCYVTDDHDYEDDSDWMM